MYYRDKLREQNALSEEIVNAITSNQIGEAIDDADLEDELEQMQQEQLDEQMLKTGTVPVSDQIQHMPAAANGESKLVIYPTTINNSANTMPLVKGKQQAIEEDDEEAELRKLQAEMAM